MDELVCSLILKSTLTAKNDKFVGGVGRSSLNIDRLFLSGWSVISTAIRNLPGGVGRKGRKKCTCASGFRMTVDARDGLLHF